MSTTLESCHALVLNADYRPLSYFPLSLWHWQDAVKAAFLERVNIVSEYDLAVHSPSCEIRLPSVIALKQYVPLARRPAFTRFNVFLRDRFSCQYCSGRFAVEDLTFDHVMPRSRGGYTSWDNVVTACTICNLAKGSRMPNECGLHPRHAPRAPRSSRHSRRRRPRVDARRRFPVAPRIRRRRRRPLKWQINSMH
ncbi:MAG: HNH endonuclease, partial [Alphaproteobacteria bacterium]|nr:HNH endonuclease [Alphaproteobacteria bacterium]